MLFRSSWIGTAITGLFAAQGIVDAAKKSKEIFRNKATGPRSIVLGRPANYPIGRKNFKVLRS